MIMPCFEKYNVGVRLTMQLTGVYQLVNTPLKRICIFYCGHLFEMLSGYRSRYNKNFPREANDLWPQVGTCLILDIQLG